ncbi:MAG TPA: molybdopterin-dependent oxidoreductase, partial [Chloroflexota bacterium]|nr:molybdopterin-dependent oxidoreductase [Chloroflexota bacterium]
NHPVNGPKHCARAEAALQGLYHPDRLQGPMRRTGERGSGQFQPISWEDGLRELIDRMRGLGAPDQAINLLAITAPLSGHRGLILNRFVSTLGGEQIVFEPFDQATLRSAIKQLFGQDRLPDFEIDKTQYLISFGADFLSTWLSPVRYGAKYGEFRQGQSQRGTLVQVEPRFSMTAANADVWIPIRPGTEGMLALSMVQVAATEGLVDTAVLQSLTGGAGTGALGPFGPEQVAQTTGVPPERIRQLARDFATKRPSLAIGGGSAAGQTNGLSNLQAIYALNYLTGSVGAPGGIRFNPPPPLPDLSTMAAGGPLTEWQRIAQQLQTSNPKPVDLVMVYGANPVYGLPASLGFGDALLHAGYIVSFSSFMDETTAMADLILPDNHFLESWGDEVPDPGPGYEVVGFQQPVVQPVWDTRDTSNLLLAVADGLGGGLRQALPWESLLEAVQEGAQQLQLMGRGSVVDANFDQFWVSLLQQGVWWDQRRTAEMPPPSPPALQLQQRSPTFAGSEADYPFHLVVFPSNSLLGGQVAHLPWLQGLPDPTTTVAWQSWLEINPETSRNLGVNTGDVVRVDSPDGSLRLPAYVHPATPPGIVAVPAGQGHTGFTRYADGRGVNPLKIVSTLTDGDTGSLAWCATRVAIRKTGQRVDLPRFEGTVPAYQLSDAPVVPTVTS